MRKILIGTTLMAAILLLPLPTLAAADYVIDTQEGHGYIAFKVSHQGFSYVMGRFNRFKGSFKYDKNRPPDFSTQVTVEVASIDTNQRKRDKHLRSKDFFHVEYFPKAVFTSTGYQDHGNGQGTLTGDLALRDVTQKIDIAITQLASGKDQWGNFRHGFAGKTTLNLIDFNLGPQGEQAELEFSVEGIRQ